METLDISWFNTQEKIERNYDKFYLSNVENLGVTFIYVNSKNEICVTRNEVVELNDSTLNRGSLVNLIRNNLKLNDLQYTLYALLRFNFTSSAESVLNGDLMGEHFSVISNIQDVVFQKCVKGLESINNLYIVLKQRCPRSQTKKVRITHKHRKTRRARY